MSKQPLITNQNKFDLKILLVGNSGAGKTHFTGTYTKGPIHYYMFDYGGEKTLAKLNQNRPECSPITIDIINPRRDDYSKFWTMLQKDERAGMFDEFASKNGLIVLPDSLTALDSMILASVAKNNSRDLTSDKNGMRIQDWGQVIAWVKSLINVINSLPCAVVTTAHLVTETDKEGNVVNRYPSVTGQYKSSIGKDFDEVYYLTTKQKSRMISMGNYDNFQAKSRVFSALKLSDPTMDIIADAYINNKLTFEGDKE
mgnify:CR=1 FL=1